MNVLLMGSGAREHILAHHLKQNSELQLYNVGSHVNPGIQCLASDVALIPFQDLKAIQGYAQQHFIDWAWIGPEAPLALGLVDALREINVPCIGPTRSLARLESSKGFTRHLQVKYHLPGALKFKIFKDKEGILDFLKELGHDYVVKADGLMGGKGVKLSGEHLRSYDEALDYCREIFEIGQTIVIEEKLKGVEFSLLCFSDGHCLKPMPLVHDHKRAFNGDWGPNTGGMGTYTDANGLLPFVTGAEMQAAFDITQYSIQALQKECQEKYVGVVYGSFMAGPQGVKLIEFNARFGDPEVINLLSLLETNFYDLSVALLEGRLSELALCFKKKASVCKYLVPEGYPDHPLKNHIIDIIEKMPEDVQFFIGSIEEDAQGFKLLGSRAIALIALADHIPEASLKIEAAIPRIQGPLFHRSDIGTEALIQQRIKVKNEAH